MDSEPIVDALRFILWGIGGAFLAAVLALTPPLLRSARGSRARAGVFARLGLLAMLWGIATPHHIPDPLFIAGLVTASLGIAIFAGSLIYIFRRPLNSE